MIEYRAKFIPFHTGSGGTSAHDLDDIEAALNCEGAWLIPFQLVQMLQQPNGWLAIMKRDVLPQEFGIDDRR